MVFSIQDHKDRIEVGYGLEGILPDAKVGDIRRSMNAQLEAGPVRPRHPVRRPADRQRHRRRRQRHPHPSPADPHPVYNYQPRQHHTNWFGLIFFLIFLLLMFRGGGGGRGWLWFLLGNMMGGGFGGGGGGER